MKAHDEALARLKAVMPEPWRLTTNFGAADFGAPCLARADMFIGPLPGAAVSVDGHGPTPDAAVDALLAAWAAAVRPTCERVRAEEREACVMERLPWAEFGAWAFEYFWHDGEPGEIDAGDAQDAAERVGLLSRRREKLDDGYECHSECGWEPGQPVSECVCLFPTRRPLREWALADEPQGKPDAGQPEGEA